jgi:hypothetical protein
MRLPLLLLLALLLSPQQTKPFARVSLGRGIAAVTLDKDVVADQMIVTVFYRQQFTPDPETTASTVAVLRSMADVQPALPGVGVAIKSVEEPSTVQFVRIELVKNAGKMEWKP